MVFAILYGFFCGCFLSLISAVAAKIYGADRLAGLSGLLLLFNAPGTSLSLSRRVKHMLVHRGLSIQPRGRSYPYIGYAAGAPIGGAILGATGNNWRIVAAYSGSVQVLGALILLYGACAHAPLV